MRLLHALSVIALAAASRLEAQAARAEPRIVLASSTPTSADVQDMKAALRTLVVKQEAFWADHGSYTTDMSELGLYTKGAPANAAPHVQVIFAGSRGWTGMATQKGMQGWSCVVFVGASEELPKLPATARSKATPSDQGVPVCDAP